MVLFLGLVLLIVVVNHPQGRDHAARWLAWGFASSGIAFAMVAAWLVDNGWWRP